MVLIANLKELSSFKSKLLQYFLSNQELVNLIRGSENNAVPDFALRYNQVFPYAWVDDTTDEEKAYICFDVDVPGVSSNAIKEVRLSIWIFAHKSIMRTPSGTLIDRMASCIDKMLNGSDEFGVSTLELKYVAREKMSKDMYGRVLVYTVKDINRWNCCDGSE